MRCFVWVGLLGAASALAPAHDAMLKRVQALVKPAQAAALALAMLPTASNAAAVASAPAPAHVPSLAAGERIFEGNCATCHRGGQNAVYLFKSRAGEEPHTLEKAVMEKYLTGGFNEAAVRAQVTNGKNAMPAFATRLSTDQVADVAAYVIDTSSKGAWVK